MMAIEFEKTEGGFYSSGNEFAFIKNDGS